MACGFVIMQICDTSFWWAKSYQSVCTFISQLPDDMPFCFTLSLYSFHSISYSAVSFSPLTALFLPCCLLADAVFVVLSRPCRPHDYCSLAISVRSSLLPFPSPRPGSQLRAFVTFPFSFRFNFLSPSLSAFLFLRKTEKETMKR